MNTSSLITAEEFAEKKYDLPDGGRWTELVEGQVVMLHPPEEAHGTVVLNLSKSLAEHAQQAEDGYACFELGLIVQRNPDTVRVPAVCYYLHGERFAEADKIATEEIPELVIDIASTNDRRKAAECSVKEYLTWGVQQVWLIETQRREIHVYEREKAARHFQDYQTLLGRPLLKGFSVRVEDLFAIPEWYT